MCSGNILYLNCGKCRIERVLCMNRSNVGASSDTTHFLMDAGLMIFSFGIIAMAFHSNITQQELITF